jgi:tRNA A-37 threonylcarbamoyl transferase component Bud32
MASVWIGEDTLLGRRVAVKTLHLELAGDESLRTRFRNEAISSASIEDPGIVGVYDTGEDEGVAYIVLEFVEGQDLRRLLDEHGPLSSAKAVSIARSVAAALDHAHRKGIVHRDVKPANVLVAADGRVKVTDFGIAKASRDDGDLTSTGAIVGTARYLAPEQVRGEPADARSDIYAAGLVLYEMLTAKAPFVADTDMGSALARLSSAPMPLPAAVPAPVAAIVERCLDIDPTRRYPTARALANALDAAADRDATAPNQITASFPVAAAATRAVSAAPAKPSRSTDRRRRLPIVAALVALLGLGAGAFVLLRGTSSPRANAHANTLAAFPIASAQDFDPFGNDGQENHALVGLAIDGNPLTAWPTETYVTRDFGHAKAGVGIYVTLVAPATARRVSVDTLEPGWNGEIFAATTASTTLAGWGRPLASGTNLGVHTQFTLRPATRARVVLLWLTLLPPSGRLDVAEIRVG